MDQIYSGTNETERYDDMIACDQVFKLLLNLKKKSNKNIDLLLLFFLNFFSLGHNAYYICMKKEGRNEKKYFLTNNFLNRTGG